MLRREGFGGARGDLHLPHRRHIGGLRRGWVGVVGDGVGAVASAVVGMVVVVMSSVSSR